jgi:hypothetical protein
MRHSSKPLEMAGAEKAAVLPSTAALSNDLRFTRESPLDDSSRRPPYDSSTRGEVPLLPRESLDTAGTP